MNVFALLLAWWQNLSSDREYRLLMYRPPLQYRLILAHAMKRFVGGCGNRKCMNSTLSDNSSCRTASSGSSSSDSWSDKTDTDEEGDAEPKEEQENPKHYTKGNSTVVQLCATPVAPIDLNAVLLSRWLEFRSGKRYRIVSFKPMKVIEKVQ